MIKHLLIGAGITLITMAIVNRVAFLKTIVNGA